MNFNQFYPKQRTGKECKKTGCERYDAYVAWKPGTTGLDFCMNCKHAHVSQYKSKALNKERKV
jgi:hypothetical protein